MDMYIYIYICSYLPYITSTTHIYIYICSYVHLCLLEDFGSKFQSTRLFLEPFEIGSSNFMGLSLLVVVEAWKTT